MRTEVFSASYAEAREKFLAAAHGSTAEIESHAHPLTGPAGEALAIDVARFGPAVATAVLWFSSGTHGIEGFCGSAAQTAAIAAGSFDTLPSGVAAIVVHAINPWGFAWQRRVNEDNVDMNRNFVDHDAPYPANPVYDALHDALCPQTWDEATRQRTAVAMAAAGERLGEREALEGASRGQYDHADGLFYGGRAPTWSNRTVARIAAERLGKARFVASLDMHTGLGPHGHGEAIATTANPEALAILENWYHDEVRLPGAGAVSGTVTGVLSDGIARNTDALVLPVVLEFGTVPRSQVRLALRADGWLHAHGDPLSDDATAIKRQIRAAFYPETQTWKRAVLERAETILALMLGGLARLSDAPSTNSAT